MKDTGDKMPTTTPAPEKKTRARKAATPVKFTPPTSEPRTDPKPAKVQPKSEEPQTLDDTENTDETKSARPTVHNGRTIVREQLLHNLPSRAPFKISKLHLDDGKLAFACRDCLFTADARGEVMEHRNAEHGTAYGKRNAIRLAAEPRTPDPVLPPRPDGSPAPSDPMEWTLREFLAMAPSLAALGDLIERLETERDQLREEVMGYRQNARFDQHKIDVYDSLRNEVIDLRTWKRNITKKLEAVGFTFAEEAE